MPTCGKDGPPRVVLVIDDLEYGGAQRQVVELANNISPERLEVHVCSLSSYVPLAAELKSPQRLHIIDTSQRWDGAVVVRLAWLLRKLRAEIVHGYLFSAEIASRLAGRLAGTRAIIGSQRTSMTYYRRKNLLAYRITKGCANLIIANSQAGAEAHRRVHGYWPRQYRVIYNGVDTDRFVPTDAAEARRRLDIAPREHVVGMFASFKPKKNHRLFFESARHVLARAPSTRLLLVGDELYGGTNGSVDYKRQVDSLIDRLGVRSRCIFLGNRDDVARLYGACDLTVLPSLAEGTANVLLESMACGVPVVATDVSDNTYIVPDGRVGYVVPLGKPKAMAERISLLLEDSTLRRRLAGLARQWVKQEFSVSRLAERTERAYRQCLTERRNQRERA